MKCSKTRKLLAAFVDRELSEPKASEVATHIAHCPDCAAEARAINAAVELLAKWDGVEPERDFEFLLRRIEQQSPVGNGSFRLPVPAWAAASAALAGILLGSLAGIHTADSPKAGPVSFEQVATAMELHAFSVNDVFEASLAEGVKPAEEIDEEAR